MVLCDPLRIDEYCVQPYSLDPGPRLALSHASRSGDKTFSLIREHFQLSVLDFDKSGIIQKLFSQGLRCRGSLMVKALNSGLKGFGLYTQRHQRSTEYMQ